MQSGRGVELQGVGKENECCSDQHTEYSLTVQTYVLLLNPISQKVTTRSPLIKVRYHILHCLRPPDARVFLIPIMTT